MKIFTEPVAEGRVLAMIIHSQHMVDRHIVDACRQKSKREKIIQMHCYGGANYGVCLRNLRLAGGFLSVELISHHGWALVFCFLSVFS